MNSGCQGNQTLFFFAPLGFLLLSNIINYGAERRGAKGNILVPYYNILLYIEQT